MEKKEPMISSYLSMFLVLAVIAAISIPGIYAQDYPRQYIIWDSELIHKTITDWAVEYPDLIRVDTSQAAFGLHSAGDSSDCPFDGENVGCLNYYGVIQDYVAHPEDSETSNHLPAILLSGSLHGDERVGPTAVMEAASLLLRATTCEALPSIPAEINESLECRQALRDQGISDAQRQWLARLVTTRRIVIVPTPNALGFYRYSREEGFVDPNRDFPYDRFDPSACMQTIASRTLNELFRGNIFQFCFTFHAGTELLGYEWGATSYLTNPFSPDDVAQSQLAEAFSLYGSGWSGHSNYKTGPMNDIIYPVRGGMEDWAYAGSWDTERMIQCEPTSYGGYPANKTVYGDAMLRSFNMLVETSYAKTPSLWNLGTSEDVLFEGTAGNGHVSRNLRLAISSLDLLEPYLSIVGINDLLMVDDIIPLKERSCTSMPIIAVSPDADEVTIHWSVGGAMTIDVTRLWTASAEEVEDAVLQDCILQPLSDEVRNVFESGQPQAGIGFFSLTESRPVEASPLDPMFSSIVDITGLSEGDEIIVIASARVDRSWSTQPTNTVVAPRVPPQAHLANVRTNPNWYHENDNKVVKGRLDWFSMPIKIVRGTSSETIQLNNRFRNGTSPSIAPQGSTTVAPIVPTPIDTASPSVPTSEITEPPSSRPISAISVFPSSADSASPSTESISEGPSSNPTENTFTDNSTDPNSSVAKRSVNLWLTFITPVFIVCVSF